MPEEGAVTIGRPPLAMARRSSEWQKDPECWIDTAAFRRVVIGRANQGRCELRQRIQV
jgi:hypothetical protein